MSFFAEPRFRCPRLWSNEELRRFAPLFEGEVANVSGWKDEDKEGGHYRDYFSRATEYRITNLRGDRGFQGLADEIELDLTHPLPADLAGRFDVIFNHTTLEHIPEVFTAFQNLSAMTRDILITVVPFAQAQHEMEDRGWDDYWRFSPSGMRYLFETNGLSVLYESATPYPRSAVYVFTIASRHPEKWRDRFPPSAPIRTAGAQIARRRAWKIWRAVGKFLRQRT